jgi:hypothetical protein
MRGGGGTPAVVAADFDRDGAIDVATSSGLGAYVSVFLNEGDGRLRDPAHHQTPQWPGVLAAGDLDGDHAPDLVVSTSSGAGPVAVLLNNGDGIFPGTSTDYSVASRSHSVALSDLDDDDDLDVAVVCYYLSDTPGELSVMLNRGDGTFIIPDYDYELGRSPTSVAAGDFNGDQLPDLAVVHGGDDNVSILVNSGGATFLPPVNYDLSDGPAHVAVHDLDGDDDLDLIVAVTQSDSIELLFNNGDGTFGPVVNYPVGLSPTCTAFGDVDGDMLPDLAVANRGSDNVSLLRNLGGGIFDLPASVVTADWPLGGSDPHWVTLADPDADEALDLLVTMPDAVELGVLFNWSSPPTSADCNGNGIPDECDTPTLCDFDANGVVELLDFVAFCEVLAGPDVAPEPPSLDCTPFYLEVFDTDVDGDVDCRDFATFQTLFQGPAS